MTSDTQEYLRAPEADMELMLVIDDLMTRLLASLNNYQPPTRASKEIVEATYQWCAAVEYWAWLSHYEMGRKP